MHTNLDAAEGGVNEVLAGIFGMNDMETFAEGCGRVGAIEEITVPELARKAQQELAARCNAPADRPGGAGEVCGCRPAGEAAGGHQRRRRKPVCRCPCHGGGLPADRRSQPPPCHRRQSGWGFRSLRRATTPPNSPVTAAVAEKLRAALPELDVLVSTENRDPYTYL